MTPIERARSMFSKMPEEVFDQFFTPLIIDDIGWPFLTIHDSLAGTDWFRILFPFTILDISQLKWKRTTQFLNKNILHPLSKGDIEAVILCSRYNMQALVPRYTKNSRQCLKWHKKFIKTTARLCAPVILASTPYGIKILDGHHRVTALFSLGLNETIPVDAWIGEIGQTENNNNSR